MADEKKDERDERMKEERGERVNTGGGAYVGGSVNTGGGDFVGRDKNVYQGERAVAAKDESALRETAEAAGANPQNAGKKLLVFLSHASQDKPVVREICERLRGDGFDPWLDEERLLPGQAWDLEIEKALRAGDAILLCFSRLSVAKEGYIQREYRRAMRYQEEKPEGTIFVIPVRLDDCEIPYTIQSLQFVDYPEGYERLVRALNVRAGRASGTAGPALEG